MNNLWMRAPLAVRTTLAVLGIGLLGLPRPTAAQTTVKQAHPGFNLFTVQQDVEIGRQSAVEAERQLRMLNDVTVDRYLNRIVQRLAAQAPGADYPYRVKVVNASDINAFALPGGPIYVHRGLLAAARNEAELAGVLAHEVSHVALRHGTHQASKAYLAKAGLGILGGLVGGRSSSSMLSAIGGVGLNAVFLKFGRDDEYEADQTGATMLAAAGYNPVAMASFFELLRQEGARNPSKLEQFFSSHPPAADREARVRQQASGLAAGKTQIVGGFDATVARLGRLPAAGSQQVVTTSPPARDGQEGGRVSVEVSEPSSRLVRFSSPSGFFTIDYPDNWRAYPSGFAVSLAPEGGVVASGEGQQAMVYGVIVNHYAPFNSSATRLDRSRIRSYAPFEDRERTRGELEEATDDLIATLLQSNPYLQAVDAQARSVLVDGAPGFSITLAGTSPLTAREERVIVYTRGLPDGHVLYALAVVPAAGYQSLEATFNRMIRSLAVNDEAVHRSTTGLRANQLRSRVR